MPSPPAIVISNDATKKPHDFAITHVHLNSGRMCEFCRKKVHLMKRRLFCDGMRITNIFLLLSLCTDLAAGGAPVPELRMRLPQEVHQAISGPDLLQ